MTPSSGKTPLRLAFTSASSNSAGFFCLRTSTGKTLSRLMFSARSSGSSFDITVSRVPRAFSSEELFKRYLPILRAARLISAIPFSLNPGGARV